jgi:hypothetical protein
MSEKLINLHCLYSSYEEVVAVPKAIGRIACPNHISKGLCHFG